MKRLVKENLLSLVPRHNIIPPLHWFVSVAAKKSVTYLVVVYTFQRYHFFIGWVQFQCSCDCRWLFVIRRILFLSHFSSNFNYFLSMLHSVLVRSLRDSFAVLNFLLVRSMLGFSVFVLFCRFHISNWTEPYHFHHYTLHHCKILLQTLYSKT